MEYIAVVLGTIYISEVGAYLWHKYAAHSKIIPEQFGVQKTHEKHHKIVEDQAHEDFHYIVGFLIISLLFLYLLFILGKISIFFAFCFYIPLFLVFVWNWYIHSAYHIENHWLNKYSWFQQDKRIHFQHHDNSETNYGIATHFSDVLFNTFDYGIKHEKY